MGAIFILNTIQAKHVYLIYIIYTVFHDLPLMHTYFMDAPLGASRYDVHKTLESSIAVTQGAEKLAMVWAIKDKNYENYHLS